MARLTSERRAALALAGAAERFWKSCCREGPGLGLALGLGLGLVLGLGLLRGLAGRSVAGAGGDLDLGAGLGVAESSAEGAAQGGVSDGVVDDADGAGATGVRSRGRSTTFS